jgi:error-prone DNA polymerase
VGLLNSQPMGFYAPAQLVRDARQHGVTVRPPDVNFSDWDSTLEPLGAGAFAVRLGLRQIDGLRADAGARILATREAPFLDIEDLRTRARLDAGTVKRLAAADALRSMSLDRRAALWEVAALKDAPDLPLFTARDTPDEGPDTPVTLPAMPKCEEVVADYQTLRLSLKAHPMAFLRASLRQQGYISTDTLQRTRPGERVSLAGLVLVRQRPGSAKGVCFITLEDEHGTANLVVWPKLMERFRKVIMGARLMVIHGKVQRDRDIIHVVAHGLEDRTDALDRLSRDPTPVPLSRADEVARPIPEGRHRHPRDVRVIPKSRDFH